MLIETIACIVTVLFFTDKCAVLNEQTHNLDSVDCKALSGCPSQPYIPSVLWQCKFDFMEKA